MSKANRKKQYEKDKNNRKKTDNHQLSDALKREFEGDERTAEQAEAEVIEELTNKISHQYTEKELYDLNADEQVAMLKAWGVTEIPKLEADKVKKILEVQKVKNV